MAPKFGDLKRYCDKNGWVMTRNTLLYNAAFIVIGTIAAIFIAVLLYELGERRLLLRLVLRHRVRLRRQHGGVQ